MKREKGTVKVNGNFWCKPELKNALVARAAKNRRTVNNEIAAILQEVLFTEHPVYNKYEAIHTESK